MKGRNWILLTMAIALSGAASNILLNMRLDIYGLFRDTHGRRLGVIDNERRTKLLLSQRYVPENFDGVLIGSSVSNNWNTGAIRNFRIYNESLDGGTISEEKLLIHKVMQKSGLKLAICVVNPGLTAVHGFSSGDMTEREYWGALGSTSLYRAYAKMVSGRTGAPRYLSDEYGTELNDDPIKLNAVLREMWAPDTEFHVDPDAFTDYRELVQELRQHGVRLAVVLPPTYEGLFEPKRQAFLRYTNRLMTVFSSKDTFIDFTAPEFNSLRQDPKNFKDGVHLSRQCAATVVEVLNERLQSEVEARTP